jgi:hypothetical protein
VNDEEFKAGLESLDPCAISYRRIMNVLAGWQDDKERLFEAKWRIPLGLLLAINHDECLQDIKNVADKYPEFIPLILKSAKEHRQGWLTRGWTHYETDAYKAAMKEIESRI